MRHARSLCLASLAEGYLIFFNDAYTGTLGTDKFDDLKENPYSEVLGDGEVITWSKGKSHMIAYNRTTIIHFTIENMSGPNRRKREHALKINFDHLR